MTETPPDKKRLLAGPHSPPHWTHTRKRLKVIGGVVAVVTLITASVLVYSAIGSDPEDVVEDYLSVLQSGDAKAAFEYASSVDDLTKASDELLVAGAMATDWQVTQLVRRHDEEESIATVDVTITAADKTSRQGRFHLDDKGPDGWRILNPLIKVDMRELTTQLAEFNGTIVDEPGLMWMFPGAYRAFGDSAGLFELSVPTYVAVPSAGAPDEEDILSPEKFLPVLKPGKDLDTELNRQLAAWIDECAESKRIEPEGCPFSATDRYTDKDIASIDGEWYRVKEVRWKVKSYPSVRLIQGLEGFSLRTVEPGKLTISGTDTDPDGSGAAEKFTGECGVDLRWTTVTLAKPRGFEFTAKTEDGLSYSCDGAHE